MINVIDVSGSQKPPLDWRGASRNGIVAVFVKSTEGVTYTSKAARPHVDQAEAAGLPVGVYHFALPDTRPGDAAREALHAMAFVRDARGRGAQLRLRIVLDVERGLARKGEPAIVTDAQLATWVCAFATNVIHAEGYAPILYANRRYLRHMRDGASKSQRGLLAHMPLWIAGDTPGTPSGWPSQPVLWQTPRRDQPWYDGRIDCNETTTDDGIRPLLIPAERGGV